MVMTLEGGDIYCLVVCPCLIQFFRPPREKKKPRNTGRGKDGKPKPQGKYLTGTALRTATLELSASRTVATTLMVCCGVRRLPIHSSSNHPDPTTSAAATLTLRNIRFPNSFGTCSSRQLHLKKSAAVRSCKSLTMRCGGPVRHLRNRHSVFAQGDDMPTIAYDESSESSQKNMAEVRSPNTMPLQ